MSLRPAPPGASLATGRLRVDAARAIAKLREYQLADRHAWVLEAIRAAVAGGATRIELRGDADDVWLGWTGPVWPASDVTRLFDELVSPEAGADRHHVRLLAAAVNSALGLAPAFVDVHAIAADGSALRTRYTPDVLAAGAPDDPTAEAPLRELACAPAPPPSGAALPARGATGMVVHLHRRFGIDVVRNLFAQHAPELLHALRACRDLAVPLHVAGQELGRHARSDELLRVPLGGGLDGWIAVTDPGAAGDHVPLAIAERGVVLEVIDAEIAPGSRPLPLRVLLDAPRMPTNASRSQVRRDGHPIATAADRLPEALPRLLAELAALLADPDRGERARAACLALVTAAAGPAFASLAQLPLVRGATGEPRPIGTFADLVHTGDEPLPRELSPWLTDMLWVPPGDPAQRLFAGRPHDPRAMRRHLRWARKELAARQAFLAHAPRPLRVLAERAAVVRIALGAPLAGSVVDGEQFGEASGELCIFHQHDPDGDRDNGELILLIEGREAERISYRSEIPFSAVIAHPRLSAIDRYRAVARDVAFNQVERAMRGGVLRAVEALAQVLHGEAVPAGHIVAPAPASERELDAALIRSGFGLARELALPGVGLLAHGPAWRVLGGARYASLAEVRGVHRFGIVAPDAALRAPRDRLILEVDSDGERWLERLLPDRFVRYDPARCATEPVAAADLAVELLAAHDLAMLVDEPGVAVALAPAAAPALTLSHCGVPLEVRSYLPRFVRCAIAIDSDQLMPARDWRGVADDAGLHAQLVRYERALLAAIAAALCGARPDDLIGFAPVEPRSEAARALWRALADHDPEELLGAPRAAALREVAAFELLGERELVSASEVARRFAGELPRVAPATPPLAGFAAVCADPPTAAALGRLAGRRTVDASEAYAAREAELTRATRRAELLARPEAPLALPDGAPGVAWTAPFGCGVVGLARDGFALHVLVERRAFAIHRDASLPPVIAVAALDFDHLDDTLAALRPEILAQVLRAVRRAIPDLVVDLATRAPATLGDTPPGRALLAVVAPLRLRKATRDLLRAAPLFATVQGGRTSLAEAHGATGWLGEWLPPAPGAPPDPPVIQLAEGGDELRALARALAPTARLDDVGPAVERLQSERLIAAGRLRAPVVPDAVPALTRKLSTFGKAAELLGSGEIALVDRGTSRLRVYLRGALAKELAVDVLPAVEIACEAPHLATNLERGLQGVVAQLALKLVDEIPAEVSLPAWLRRSLRRALLSGVRSPRLIALPVFATTLDAWVPWTAVQAQVAQLGDLWCTEEAPASPASERTPLAERRIALVLSAAEQALATAAGMRVVDAARELALDAVARDNLTRPRDPARLQPPAFALSAIELDGNGRTSPRGYVALLPPAEVHRRGLRATRELHPFDPAPDPCAWPTLAIVDDARLAPDRVWARAVEDAAWQAVRERVTEASVRAARRLVAIPPTALAPHAVSADHRALAALRGTPGVEIRGSLWLAGGPRTQHPIEVTDRRRTWPFLSQHRLGIAGRLFVFSTPAGEPTPAALSAALDELLLVVHANQCRGLVAGGGRTDLVAAHLAHAIARGHLPPADAGNHRFACFRPRPLTALELHAMLRGTPPALAQFAVVEDDSLLATTVLEALGPRARRAGDPPLPEIPQPPPRTRHARKPPPQPPRPPHALDPLIAALSARLAPLALSLPPFAIVATARTPLVAVAPSRIELAGESPVLRALALDLAPEPVALLAAHVVSLLNLANTPLTDAAELHALALLAAD